MTQLASRAMAVLTLFAAILTVGMAASVQDDLTKKQRTSLLQEVEKGLHRAKTDQEWAETLYRLEEARYTTIVEFVGERLLKEKSIDRQLIAAELLTTYTKPVRVRNAAGRALEKSLSRKKPDMDVLDRCVEGLGVLKYAPAIEALGVVLDRWRRDQWMPLAVLKVYDQIGDRAALPFVHATWKKMDDAAEAGTRGSGVGARGARPGSASNNKRAPPPPGALREKFIATSRLLTEDDEIETHQHLGQWLKLNPLED
jgi:hypothetical protein